METALARAAAGGGAITLRGLGKRSAESQVQGETASLQGPPGAAWEPGGHCEQPGLLLDDDHTDKLCCLFAGFADDEDEDLAAAIAASMQDQPEALPGPSSAAAGLAPRGSYAAVTKKANSLEAHSQPQHTGVFAGVCACVGV
jgi:hypothetical protein